MSRHDSDNEERYWELQLDGKQVLVVLAGILLLCAVSFHFGRRVGRTDSTQAGTEMSALVENAAAGEVVSDEDAAAGMTFFDTVGRRADGQAPPPVTSGEAGDSVAETPQPIADRQEAETAPEVVVPPARPEPQKPGPQPAASSAQAGGFLVQVAAYSERARADALVGSLRQKGYNAEVATDSSSGRTLYKVRVGGFPDRASADRTKERLVREEKQQAWVLPAGG